MIIVNKAVGSVRISDIQITLQHKQIIKISEYVESALLQKSLMSPHGNLFLAEKNDLIKIIREHDQSYAHHERLIKAEANFIDPETKLVKTREGALKFFSLKTEEERIDFVNQLSYLYYDFLIELKPKLLSPDTINIKRTIDAKIDSFRDRRISENFVMLDFS
jgi:hypothetical protein